MEPAMSDTLMILPASDTKSIRLVRVPDDFESHEAFRHVTGLIATVEEQDPNCDLDDILATLEDHGFETVEFLLGPSLP
jgi:predicted TIM-barrel enzyme